MSNQEESAPTPPVDRHDGFSQGPRAWWALWTKLVQWGVGNPWIVWSLVAVNLISSAAGYVYWYGDSILAAPPYFWPFVPDSPLSATLWAVALVAFHRSRQWNLLGLLAATGAIKYGLWTDWVWFTNAYLSDGQYTMEAIVLSLNHFGMALEGLALLPLITYTGRTVLPVIVWYTINDFIDYGLNYRPHIPNPDALASITGFALLTTLALSALWLGLALRNRTVSLGPANIPPPI